MEFIIKDGLEGEVTVIESPERLDAVVASDFKAKISELVRQNKYKLVIDLSKTKFMDSSGLGALVSRIAITKSNNGDIRVAAPQKYVLELLEITHLNKVLRVFDDVESAIDSY